MSCTFCMSKSITRWLWIEAYPLIDARQGGMSRTTPARSCAGRLSAAPGCRRPRIRAFPLIRNCRMRSESRLQDCRKHRSTVRETFAVERPHFVHARIRSCRVAAFDHIVRRGTRHRLVARDALTRRSAPRSRTFRRRDERLVRASVAPCCAAVSRTGSARRCRNSLTRMTQRRRAPAPMSELTAMENGSYPNDSDALRSSPLAAPQGPGFQ